MLWVGGVFLFLISRNGEGKEMGGWVGGWVGTYPAGRRRR